MQLYDTKVYKTVNTCPGTLTNYQCKSSKNVFILSSMYRSINILILDNKKKKLDTVISYNETKVAVYTYDQIIRLYNTKFGSCR